MKTKEIIAQIRRFNEARGVRKCDFINSKDTIESLIEKLVSDKGLVYAKQTNFPSIDIFRRYKVDCQRCNIFVDRGVLAKNQPFLVLTGRGSSDLLYDNNSRVYDVYLMHGAKAKIRATNGALVSLHNISGCAEIFQDCYGKIIQL